MIRYTQGDILQAEAEALVNTVNCVGVMGRGIALQFRQAFPANFKAYASACSRGEVQPGRMFVFDTGQLTMPRYIINFPTKRHWRGKSRIEDIEEGLVALVDEIRSRHIRSIAIPPLGSGLGGLEWSEVRPRIESALSAVPDVEVIVFQPRGAHDGAEVLNTGSGRAPRMTPGRAALVSLMSRYLHALLDPTITLLEIHKLMYFLQAAGEPLRLRYVRAPYGPYAENLRHVLRRIEGYLIVGYSHGCESPDEPLSLVPGAVRDAEAYLAHHVDTSQRIARVAQLVEGYETPYGLELLATVHWVATQEEVIQLSEMVRRVHGWNARKRQMSPGQIELAMQRLRSQGWIG